MPHSQLCCCSGGWLESWRGWNCQLEHLGVATAAWQHQGGPAFRVVIHDSERHGLEAAGFLEPGPSRALGLPAVKLCCLPGHPDNSATPAGSKAPRFWSETVIL